MTDDPAEIGRALRIPPCKGCREPLGGRYGPRRLCWSCWVKERPSRGRTPPRRDQGSAFQRLVDRVWQGLAAQGGRVHYLARDHVGAVCPICERGSVSIWFIDADPPEIEIERDCCTAGCQGRKIARWVGA